MQKQGIFITFEGIEACGKTSQIQLLAQWLTQLGYSVITTREPGGTEMGEVLRNLLKKISSSIKIFPETELLLFAACRAQLIGELVKPALDRGEIVLCDRFFDSTIVYQGIGRKLNRQIIDTLNSFTCNAIVPNLTFLMDIPIKISQERIALRTQTSIDRFEQEDSTFFESLRQAYLDLAITLPQRFVVIDGTQSPRTIEIAIQQKVKGLLRGHVP